MKQVISVFMLLFLFSCSKDDNKNGKAINESKMLDINGIKQFVMIRGENDKNPVLLHIHGGPGVSEIGGLRKYNKDLEESFTVVYWDQRNAGKSFQPNFPVSEIKVSKYVSDIDVLAKYLKNRLNVKKMIMVGHSWGSQIGIIAAQKFPEHFSAFVGTGQQVAAYDGELQSYRYALAKAQEFGIDSMVQQLIFIGEPKSGDFRTMYNIPEGFSIQKYLLFELNRRIYNGFTVEKLFANFQESDEYTAAEKETFLPGAEFANKHIENDPDYIDFDLRKTVKKLEIPIFLIAGKYDYINPTPLAKGYFDLITVPKKEFILFENSGHDPAWEEPIKYRNELIRISKLVN